MRMMGMAPWGLPRMLRACRCRTWQHLLLQLLLQAWAQGGVPLLPPLRLPLRPDKRAVARHGGTLAVQWQVGMGVMRVEPAVLPAITALVAARSIVPREQ